MSFLKFQLYALLNSLSAIGRGLGAGINFRPSYHIFRIRGTVSAFADLFTANCVLCNLQFCDEQNKYIYTPYVTVILLDDDRRYVEKLSELLVRWQSFIIVNVTYKCWANPVELIQVHSVRISKLCRRLPVPVEILTLKTKVFLFLTLFAIFLYNT